MFFVKIPTMWRKITKISNGQITGFSISTTQLDSDYHPYPCFVAPDGVTVLAWVAIGKYCSSSASTMNSVNATPVWQTIGNARTNATTLGNGYQQYDWMLQKLFVDLALVNYGNVDFNPGRTIANYLGIYHLDKHVWVDGVTKDGTTWRIAKNPNSYVNSAGSSTEGYQTLGYSMPGNYNYITKLGYDSTNEFANFPLAGGGTQSTYYCDFFYWSDGNKAVYSIVGSAHNYAGLWYYDVSVEWSDNRSARLCYRPVST